ncbi:toll/interleukin-1 receptor domain-containing protein [Stratiformator vulcanicus]|uniref:TIR domain-containing protein n=1 Tax=Stratiformator vulcanicus TaxID=2527980 RepID=A0A517QX76_9PLAN|nr:toll/interleukin-1 receptor domain-containing protein [Stratiformator vulcanicus]QDT36197.1 hypothetical protein Pan189_05520 [Stratiformator vulcanicus]
MAKLFICRKCGQRIRTSGYAQVRPERCSRCRALLEGDGIECPDHDVFISFSSVDLEDATQISQLLQREGFPSFFSQTGISAGDDWQEKLVSALEEVRAVVLVLSRDADQSVHVQREIKIAVEEKLPIVTYKLKSFREKKLRYAVTGLHFIEAYRLGKKESRRRLVKDVEEAVKRGRSRKTFVVQVSQWAQERWRGIRKTSKYLTLAATVAIVTLCATVWSMSTTSAARTEQLAESIQTSLPSTWGRREPSDASFSVEPGEHELIVTGTLDQQIAVMKDLNGRRRSSDVEPLKALVEGEMCRGFCDPADRPVYEKLFQLVRTNFDGMPLRQSLDAFDDVLRLGLDIDEAALKREGVYSGVEIELKLPPRPLHEIFRRVLHQHGWGYFVDRGVLRIVPKGDAAKRRYRVFFDVRDLVGIEIPEEDLAAISPSLTTTSNASDVTTSEIPVVPPEVVLDSDIAEQRQTVPIYREKVEIKLTGPSTIRAAFVDDNAETSHFFRPPEHLVYEAEAFSNIARAASDARETSLTEFKIRFADLSRTEGKEIVGRFVAYGNRERLSNDPFHLKSNDDDLGGLPLPLKITDRIASFVASGCQVDVVWYRPAPDSVAMLLEPEVSVTDSTDHELSQLSESCASGASPPAGAQTALEWAHARGLVIGRMTLSKAE